ncbi:PAAR domain-containing protein [Ancylomarina sp. 16SWW S1-10-2]|uniref:PAAR domain-containing protein n=1 Tax=Ancylomarina sp. 16SWW S1-10-2 TaxID=2499681 RepID=UPI0012AEA6B3|nr:PAAR domain-containing protein [Ancylomarina sp. 16SWW S1-10-2]MRT94765.1 hypothetical protein [Ancylomarina sp. 16SWW S1-10-2]
MAGKPIATMGSMHVCPMVTVLVPHVGGPIVGPGAPNVLINGKPAALMGDMCVCIGPPDVVAQGNPAVLINGVPVVCQGDLTAHGGVVMSGEANILISTATPTPQATLPLSQIPFPEIGLVEKLGAALNRDTVDLQEAQGNIEAIQRGDAEAEPKIFNLQWKAGRSVIRNSKVLKTVTLTASVLNIDDGETFNLTIDRGAVQNISDESTEEDANGEEPQTVQVTVQDKKISHTWNIEELIEENE